MKKNLYLTTFQTEPEICLHCHPTGPIVGSLSTNVLLSLVSYSPSPLQAVISDLCTVPVFPL